MKLHEAALYELSLAHLLAEVKEEYQRSRDYLLKLLEAANRTDGVQSVGITLPGRRQRIATASLVQRSHEKPTVTNEAEFIGWVCLYYPDQVVRRLEVAPEFQKEVLQQIAKTRTATYQPADGKAREVPGVTVSNTAPANSHTIRFGNREEDEKALCAAHEDGILPVPRLKFHLAVEDSRST
ncbi:hypothetical protein [Streptomyces sp. NPDC049879]|uniref:hypothetical protein n=1 Tax=Streptomyces sp. NPDC049879 TaxID=3365598 RepID=UPI0037B276CF